MWQQWVVFLIVALAALHAGGKYLPASWRARMVYSLARLLNRQGARGLAASLQRRVDAEAGCGGGGCSGCAGKTPCSADAAQASGDGAQHPTRRIIVLHQEPSIAPRR